MKNIEIILRQYAKQQGTIVRGTSDLSPLEEWLLSRIVKSTKDSAAEILEKHHHTLQLNRYEMKQEFEMTQEEMDNIIAINKGGGDPVMFLSGGTPMGSSLQEKINQYWNILGDKYGFKPMTVEGSARGKLFFLAEPKPIVKPKTQTEIEMDKYDTLDKIIKQLESCNYECEGGVLKRNVAFLALKRMANH